jgi:Undecaprenyl-phosphate glucose phosphotransferase
MSASVQTVQDILQRHEVAAPLSQSVVAGLVGFLDLGAVATCGLLIVAILGRVTVGPAEIAAISLCALLLVLGLHAAGAYDFRAIMNPGRSAPLVIAVSAFVFLVLIALAFAFKMSSDISRLWAFSWMTSVVVLVLIFRGIAATVTRRLAEAGRIGRRIVIYGAGLQGQRIVERIEQLDEPWNRIVGVFDDRLARTAPMLGRYPVLGNLSDLVEWGRRQCPDEILVAIPWGAEERLVDILQTLAVLPANVRLCSEFQRVDLIQGRANSQYGITMLNAFEKPQAGWGRIFKRCFDIGLACAAIVVCLPMMVLIACCIKLEGPGPVLFRQKRYGFNNKLIEIYKFRTMHATACDAMANRLTERDDPRVTRIGALLRRLSLDELPQLLNVLRGEMSVVGPRPHAIRTTAGGRECDEVVNQYAVRHKVKPGITGWAQVNGWRGTMQDEEHLIKRVEHDMYYINNWTPLFDIQILLRTVWVVLQGRNSF